MLEHAPHISSLNSSIKHSIKPKTSISQVPLTIRIVSVEMNLPSFQVWATSGPGIRVKFVVEGPDVAALDFFGEGDSGDSGDLHGFFCFF